jgi:peptidoglycan-associated lipoprotein
VPSQPEAAGSGSRRGDARASPGHDSCASAPPPPAPAASKTAPPTEDEVFRNKTLDQLNAEKPLTDTFFAWIQSSCHRGSQRSPEERRLDEALDDTKVMVEGHADSAARTNTTWRSGSGVPTRFATTWSALGIPAERITIVSKGEEQPFCMGRDEPCWQQNRADTSS